jgi:GT2 family glycosyltransferase
MLDIARFWLDSAPATGGRREPPDHIEVNGSLVEALDAPERQDAQALPFVSVVVVAHGGQTALAQCLDALEAQTYPTDRMEVIVVGTSPHDSALARMVAAVARRRPGLRLRYATRAAHRGTAAARNSGWRFARGQMVGFTEDAAIPSREWVEAAASAFGPDVDVISGTVITPLAARPTAAALQTAERMHAPWSGANVFYRRAVLTRLGGFDERFASGFHADTDLALAALQAGASFGTAERAVVVRKEAGQSWLTPLRETREQFDEALLFRKYPQLYGRYVRRAPPLGQYAAAGALLSMMAGALSRRRGLTRAGGAIWLSLLLLAFGGAARRTSDHPRDLAELLLVTAFSPVAAVAFRLAGAVRHRVWFV